MRTPEVTREFRDKCEELAALYDIPEIKALLFAASCQIRRTTQEIGPSEVSSIVPVNEQKEG